MDVSNKITEGIINIEKYCKKLDKKANLHYRNPNNEHELIFRGESQCDGIKSSAARRLAKYNKVLSQADFLDYHSALISKARAIIPDTTKNDLEILLEIQHNKGATCLTEYTTSFFIALWFACSASPDTDGQVYFIDLRNEKHEGDVKELTEGLIKQYKGKHSLIISLLKEKDHKRKAAQTFWVWKPKMSEKPFLLAQKCLYVFGLASSELLHREGETSILIKKEKKEDILKALAAYFGITHESLFPDIASFSYTQGCFSAPRDLINNENNRFTEASFYEESGDYKKATEIYEDLLKKAKRETDLVLSYRVARKLGKCYIQEAKLTRDRCTTGKNCFICNNECKSNQNKAVEKFLEANISAQHWKESDPEYENKIRYELADVYYDILAYDKVLEQYEMIFTTNRPSDSKAIDLLACAELCMFLEMPSIKKDKLEMPSIEKTQLEKPEAKPEDCKKKYFHFLHEAQKEINKLKDQKVSAKHQKDEKGIRESQVQYLKIIMCVIQVERTSLRQNRSFNIKRRNIIYAAFDALIKKEYSPQLLWDFNDAETAISHMDINVNQTRPIYETIQHLNDLNARLKSARYKSKSA